MCLRRYILEACLVSLTIGSSVPEQPFPSEFGAQAAPGATFPAAASPLESLAVGASANTQRLPQLDEFPRASDDLNTRSYAGLGVTPGLQDYKPSSMVRRETAPTITAHDLSRRILEDTQNLMRTDSEDGDSESPHKPLFQEDPRFSPEAIFSNKQIAPEIAEFLGHLAQRSRVHRKETAREARQAGLIAEGRGHHVANHEAEDDSDDIEDMKKSLKSAPKKTPLANFFEKMDEKTNAASWTPSECAALSKNVTEKYARMVGRSAASWDTTGPAGAEGRAEVHTGMFFRHWKINGDNMKVAARKLRLGVLSFLATQDAGKVKLHIWTDVDRSNNTIREMLGPIAQHPEFMDAINITTFDPEVEFSKVPPTLARETLAERFKKDTMPELRPDLYRSVVLYNYGGIWMDADTVLMQDVAPLLGEDWAYLVRGNEGAIDGALLSASKPMSHFVNEYLIKLVMRQEPFFGEVQKPLLVEIFDKDPAHTMMHALPPCFLDSDSAISGKESAVLTADAAPGSDFFGKPVGDAYRDYFSVGIQDAVQDNSTAEVSVLEDSSFHFQQSNDDDDKPAISSPVWAYHWRGNFGAPWARGSLADVAERTFIHKLNLNKHGWN